MMKSLTSFDFSSESWKKYKHCFQPVYGEMHNYKLLFTVYFVACLSNINKYSLCIAALALKDADDSNVT